MRENEVVELHGPFAAPIFLSSFGCGALRSKVTLGDSELANYLQILFKKKFDLFWTFLYNYNVLVFKYMWIH